MAQNRTTGLKRPLEPLALIGSWLGIAAGWASVILLSPLYLVGGPAFLYGRLVTRPLLMCTARLGSRLAGAISATMGGNAADAKLLLVQLGSVALPAIGLLSVAAPVFALDFVVGQHDPSSKTTVDFVPEWVFLLIGFGGLIAFIIGVVGMESEQHTAFNIEQKSDLEDAHQAVLSLLYRRSAHRRSPVEHRYQAVASILREQGFRFVRRTQMQEDVWVTQDAGKIVSMPVSTSGVFTLTTSLAFCSLAATLTFIAISCAYFLSGGYWENGGTTLLIGIALGGGFVICGKYAKEFGNWAGQFRLKIERVSHVGCSE